MFIDITFALCRYQHLVDKYYVTCIQMARDGIGNCRVWCKVDCCFTIMSYDDFVYYLIFS